MVWLSSNRMQVSLDRHCRFQRFVDIKRVNSDAFSVHSSSLHAPSFCYIQIANHLSRPTYRPSSPLHPARLYRAHHSHRHQHLSLRPAPYVSPNRRYHRLRPKCQACCDRHTRVTVRSRAFPSAGHRHDQKVWAVGEVADDKHWKCKVAKGRRTSFPSAAQPCL
jgi:hypothetical protein